MPAALLSLLIGSMIALRLLMFQGHTIQQGHDRSMQAMTAGEFQDLLAATQSFVSSNASSLPSQIPVGGTKEVFLTQLNLLPNFSNQNPYGQTWHVYLQQPTSGQITAMVVTTGDATIPLPSLTNIAALSGSHAGYVGEDNVAPGMSSQMAIGAGGGWRMPLGGFPYNPGSGHLFGLSTSASGAQYNSDALYRDAVPNHPELSGMNTTLTMNGNDINSIGNANVTNNVNVGNQVNTNSLVVSPGNNIHEGTLSIYGDAGSGASIFSPGTVNFQKPGGGYAPIYAGQLGLPVGANIQEGWVSWYGDIYNAAVRAPSAFYVQHLDGTAADAYVQNLMASNGVKLGATSTAGGYCNQPGMLTASSDGSGNTLACINQYWTSLAATFNNGSWVSGTLAPNAMNGSFYNQSTTAAAVTVTCPNRVHDLQIKIQVGGNIVYDTGAFVGSGYNSVQSASFIVPGRQYYWVTLSGYPGEDGHCYITAQW